MLEIAEARISDTPDIIDIWKEAGITRPWKAPEADIALSLNTPLSTIFLGKHEGQTVATVMAGFEGHRGWIYYLAVLPEFQSRGFGRMLYTHAENWLKEKGAPKIHILIRHDNRKVINFYEQLGFETSTSVLMGKVLGYA